MEEKGLLFDAAVHSRSRMTPLDLIAGISFHFLWQSCAGTTDYDFKSISNVYMCIFRGRDRQTQTDIDLLQGIDSYNYGSGQVWHL